MAQSGHSHKKLSNRNPRKVYVSNISRDTRERDLGRLFEEAGRIDRLQFKNRFAFIEYERSRGCEDAVHKFDGMYFMGRRLRVEPYCYRGGDRKYRSDNYSNDYRIYITNLDSMTSWQDLKDFGRTAGKSVTFADVRMLRTSSEGDKKDKNSGGGGGGDSAGNNVGGKGDLEGIIEYSDSADHENALKELDGARLNGVRVKVHSKSHYDRANEHRNRSHSPQQSRGHMHGRGRGGGGSGSGSGRGGGGGRSPYRSRSRSRSRSRGRNGQRQHGRRSRSRSMDGAKGRGATAYKSLSRSPKREVM